MTGDDQSLTGIENHDGHKIFSSGIQTAGADDTTSMSKGVQAMGKRIAPNTSHNQTRHKKKFPTKLGELNHSQVAVDEIKQESYEHLKNSS